MLATSKVFVKSEDDEVEAEAEVEAEEAEVDFGANVETSIASTTGFATKN